ncbi:MAG: SEC-C metal-binding domain-containing protein [Thermoanaerobaculales bacterium]
MAEAGAVHPGRNEPCHCGSGKKYKHCCLAKDEEAERASRAQQTSAAPPPAPPEEEPSPRPTPPPRAQGQPWKRAAKTARGPRRITTPRKAG